MRLPRRVPARVTGAAAAAPWMSCVLAAGVLLRVVVLVTYRTPFEFPDSLGYLDDAHPLRQSVWHPVGYSAFLRVLSLVRWFPVVVVVQAVMGIVLGVLIYRLLRGFGVSDRAAALGAAPVLLDAWQLDLEHFVLSETMFELLLVGGCYLLLRSRRTATAAAAGLLLSGAVLTRTVGLVAAAAVVLAVLLRGGAWRRAAVAVVALALPLVAYAVRFHQSYGVVALQGFSGRQLYGVVATYVRCPPRTAHPLDATLCPRLPVGARPGNNQYTWSSASPVAVLAHRAAATSRHPEIVSDQQLQSWSRGITRQQPGGYAQYVAQATLHYFTIGRVAGALDPPQQAWQFPALRYSPPTFANDVTPKAFNHRAFVPAPPGPLAPALRAYQQVGYVPGPALLLGLVIAVAAPVLAWRRRGAIEAAALGIAGFTLVFVPGFVAGFDYRYAVPALALIPPGAVLGWHALGSRFPRLVARTPRHVALLTVVALALLGTNLVRPSVTPRSYEVATRLLPLGTEQRLPDGMAVDVGSPRLIWTACTPARQPGRQGVTGAMVAFHLTATNPKPERRLFTALNLSLRTSARPSSGERLAPLLPAVVDRTVSKRYPTGSGWQGFLLRSTRGELDYTDQTGGGAVGWRFDVTSLLAGQPIPGTPCGADTPRGSGPPDRRL